MIRHLQDANQAVARLTLGLLVTTSVIAVIAIAVADHVGGGAERGSRLAIAAITVATSLVAIWFSRRNQLRVGLAIAFSAIGFALVLHAYLADLGVHAYVLSIQCLLITGSYMLLGRRFGHAAALWSFGSIAGLYWLELSSPAFHSRQWAVPSHNVVVVYAILYAIAAVIGWRYQVYFETLLAELNKQGVQFRYLFHAMPNGCMLSRDGVILHANEPYAVHFGKPGAEALIGRRLIDLAQAHTRDRTLARINEINALPPGQSLPVIDYEVDSANGARRRIRVETRKVVLADGPAALSVTSDVTAETVAIAELGRERQKAESANQAKSDFLAIMSHEIRTPLNAIIGLTDVMRNETVDPATQKRYLALVADSSQTLLQLLNDVLDLSKIEAGKLQLQLEAVDLRRMFATMGATYTALAHEKGLDFSAEVDAAVPRLLLADALRLRQVVGNLVSNAIKFTNCGSISLRAYVCRNAVYCIEVRDTGIGVRQEDLSKLFLAFSQAGTTTSRDLGGTGLGLALCRDLAALMGGSISVQSSPERGSTFTVELPLKLAGEQAGTATAGRALSGDRRRFDGARVLVVEDNEVNGLVIKAMLMLRGAAPEVCVDSASAMARCRDQRFDLVLLDINLPDEDGYDCALRIRALDHMRACPIIAFTASPLDTGDPRFAGARFADVLYKPATQEEVERVLARWIGNDPVAATESTAKGVSLGTR